MTWMRLAFTAPIILPILCLVAVLLRKRRASGSRALFRASLLVALLPFVSHIWLRLGFLMRVLEHEDHPAGRTAAISSAWTSAIASVALMAVLLAVAWWIASRSAVVASFLPTVAWLCYWLLLHPWLEGSLPPRAHFDNKPSMGLFGLGVFAQVQLLVTALIAQGAIESAD